jgi:hypothetical protein
MRGGQRLAGRYSLQDLNPLRFSNLRNRQAHNLKGRRFESYSRNNFNFAKYSPRLLAPSKGLGIAVFSEPPKCPDGVAGALFVLGRAFFSPDLRTSAGQPLADNPLISQAK